MNSKMSKFINSEHYKRLQEIAQSDTFKQIQQITQSENYQSAMKTLQKRESLIHRDTLVQIAKYQSEMMEKVKAVS